MSKRYRGISDSQANAEALARRNAPYSTTHAASVEVAWDYRQHIPDDLRGMVRAVRRAYADEVPTKLHDAEIGEGGTPRMTNAALTYLDSPQASDAVRGEQPLTSHYLTPFRACEDRMLRAGPRLARQARMVRHIVSGQEPAAAALAEGAHLFDSSISAESALREFLRRMSDLKVHLAKEAVEAA